MPHVDHLDQMSRGRFVADLLTIDFGFEYEDVELFRTVISHCAKVGDFTTRHMLEDMVEDSEEHLDWFETQLQTIAIRSRYPPRCKSWRPHY